MISAELSRRAALAVANADLSPEQRIAIAEASAQCDDAEFTARFGQLLEPPGLAAQVLGFAFHFNPLERRDAHGRWTRDGGATEQLHIGKGLKEAFNLPGQHQVHYTASGPMVDEARPEADKAAKIVPGLIGGRNETFNGTIKVFPAADKPDVLAELDWNGDLHLQDGVVTAMASGRAHPDEPLQYPDAFQVVEHEMIHGVIPPGSEEANRAAYNNPTMAAADIEEGFTEYGATVHAPEFLDKMGLADRNTDVEKSGFVSWDASGKPVKNYYTVREMAQDMADPVNINEGNSWGHYPTQVRDAQDWVQEVAKAEGHGDLRPGTPGHDRVVALSDEVNRQGAAGKITVMARQLAMAMTRDHPKVRNDPQSMANLTASIDRDIHQQWSTGHAIDTVTREKQRVQQQVEQVEREMAERAG